MIRKQVYACLLQLGYGFKLGNSSILTIERAVLCAAVNIAYCNGLTGVVELVYALSTLVVGKCCAVPAIGYIQASSGNRVSIFLYADYSMWSSFCICVANVIAIMVQRGKKITC